MSTQQQADEQLMARVAEGDTMAFNQLVRQHLPRAYAIARRTLTSNPDAEDAAQEAFTKIWVNAKDYDPAKAKFTTWLHRIVVNTSLDMARKKRPVAVEDSVLHAVPDSADNAEMLVAAQEQRVTVQGAIAALPAQQRAAITLCYTEEYSNAEAAKIMGVHIKALEGLLVRARKSLRQALQGLNNGERDAA
jgi:RNA polymerase sigma-70 factor (ECF subfamily)